MSEVKRFNVDGNVFLFVNEFRSNRSGFVHESELFINDSFQGSAKVQYYNRTWENYDFQTSMKKCLRSLIDEQKNELVKIYKQNHNVKSLRGQVKKNCENLINNDDRIILLTKAVDIL